MPAARDVAGPEQAAQRCALERDRVDSSVLGTHRASMRGVQMIHKGVSSAPWCQRSPLGTTHYRR